MLFEAHHEISETVFRRPQQRHFADRSSANSGAKAALQRHATRILRRVAGLHEIVSESRRGSSAVRVSLSTETLFVDVVERRAEFQNSPRSRGPNGRW